MQHTGTFTTENQSPPSHKERFQGSFFKHTTDWGHHESPGVLGLSGLIQLLEKQLEADENVTSKIKHESYLWVRTVCLTSEISSY